MYKILTVAAAVTFGMMGGMATAADYPSKPVSFVVPWPPGDLEDVLTRMIAEDFQDKYGVAAAVINKPGSGGGPFPGAEVVAQADADGSVVGSFVIGVPVIGPTIGFDWLDENTFEALGIFLTYPFVLVAAGDAPYDTIEEMADYAKTNELVLGHFGAALTPTQVSFAAASSMGFEWGSEAAFDMLDCNTLASGDADIINTTIQLVLPCLDQVKVLASMTNERIKLVPDAPTMGELIPALCGGLDGNIDDDLRRLLANGVKQGGMALRNPCDMSDMLFNASTEATSLLVTALNGGEKLSNNAQLEE